MHEWRLTTRHTEHTRSTHGAQCQQRAGAALDWSLACPKDGVSIGPHALLCSADFAWPRLADVDRIAGLL
ncbi:uncharacterized protein UV8b_02381 [Ustilaginoidea virens]|uniref:Uncharacterized protein n=1 Tax=Ustilaginoidea virens TaxID=1159556 RepID=A0A8E5HMD8_USTVR|nr:uncharacterized protein UV8b_02381 [Ustilaginoidea virens]QUC18140.1 hypothetical protein UV8b_02381 [Ustilaginoidea virens]